MHTRSLGFCGCPPVLSGQEEPQRFRGRRVQLPAGFDTIACLPVTLLTALLADVTVEDDLRAAGQPNSALQLN